MELLRSELVTALDDAHVAARTAAIGHRHAAEVAEGSECGPLFRQLARDHEQLVEQIRRLIERQGARPKEPDPDRVGLVEIARRARELFSSDEELTLIREREHDEDALARALAAARQVDGSAPIDRELAELCGRVHGAQDELAQLRAWLTRTPA